MSKEIEKLGKDVFAKHVDYYLKLALGSLNQVVMTRNGGNPPDKNFESRKFFLDSQLLQNSIIPQLKNYLVMLTAREGSLEGVLTPK